MGEAFGVSAIYGECAAAGGSDVMILEDFLHFMAASPQRMKIKASLALRPFADDR